MLTPERRREIEKRLRDFDDYRAPLANPRPGQWRAGAGWEDRLAAMARELLAEVERLTIPAFGPGAPAWSLFHQAWTQAVGTPGYQKQTWLALERLLSEAAKSFEEEKR